MKSYKLCTMALGCFVLSIYPAAAKAPIEQTVIAVSGQIITGERISTAEGPCIIIPPDVKNVRIQSNQIGPCGTTVDDVGILIKKAAHHIYIGSNTIHGVSTAIFADHADHPITIDRNTAFDIRGPAPMGQMVRFENVANKGFKSRIYANISDKTLSQYPTAYEDHISLRASSGSPDNALVIACNKIRGGDSLVGSGISIGKDGGKWIVVRDNIIVLTPNTGISIAGAEWSRVYRNMIWNRGKDKKSGTDKAISVFKYKESLPNNVEISKNLTIANSWLTNGDGSIGAGISDDRSGRFINYAANNWKYMLLKENVWDTSRVDCQQ